MQLRHFQRWTEVGSVTYSAMLTLDSGAYPSNNPGPPEVM